MCTTGLPDNVMVTSLPGTALGFGQAMEEVFLVFGYSYKNPDLVKSQMHLTNFASLAELYTFIMQVSY